MNIRLFFMELPAGPVLNALDRKLAGIAKTQESIDGGRRLWITHVPETAFRPFLHAKPFDICVGPVRFSSSEIEEYKVGIGSVPKRCMICHSYEDNADVLNVLFSLISEIMSCTGALMCIDETAGETLFGRDKLDDEFTPHQLEGYPGNVYEIAHENNDGDLGFEWLVDARWFQAWHRVKIQKSDAVPHSEEASRFASLDYT